jgi:ketosteroid isomerase-like protein
VSGENERLVREMYAAFRGESGADPLSFFSEDVVLDATARPDGGVGRGRENLNAVIGAWIGEFEDWSEDLESITGHGDHHVILIATQRGRGRGSGIETEDRYAVLYRVRDGQIAEMKLYGDPEDAERDVKS